ncbi:TonB-dependent receptor [Rufibacter glacialis]|nr:TonB-dependent receptor [Rufibacter glacialis]GGK88969.1 membrane protein [Rufibacter glacialis]
MNVPATAPGVTPCGLTLSGLILDRDAGTPLVGATVQIQGTSHATSTNAQGRYQFTGLCAGPVAVTVSYLGFSPETRQKRLRSTVESLDFALHVDATLLKSVEVTGHQLPASGATAGSTLTGQALEKAQGGSLAQALTQVSGVTMLQTGGTIAKPVIHGLHSNRILTLNNGIRQEGQQWGAEHAPEIDPFIANRLTVVKGAEAVRYGPEAMGGVVLVEPPALPSTPELHGQLTTVGASNGRSGTVSGMLNGGLKQVPGLGWRVQGTLKKAGNLKTADYYLENTGLREVNYSAALGYTSEKIGAELFYSRFQTELGIFKGAHIGSLEDLMTRISAERPWEEGAFSYQVGVPRQQIDHHLLKAKGHLHLGEGENLDVVYGLQYNQRQEFDIRRGEYRSVPSLDMALTTQTLEVAYDKLFSRGLKITTGLNGMLQINNNVPGTGAIPLIPNYDSYAGGGYLMGKLIRETWELEAGARYDYKYVNARGYYENAQAYGGIRRFHNVTGSLGGALHLHPAWTIRTNLGSAWRPPVVNELYSNGLHHGTASYETGDATLQSEKSYKWTNTLEYHANNLQLEFTAYANHIQDYIYLEPAGGFYESLRGSFPTFRYRQTDARFWGSDVSLQYDFWKPFRYELKGSLVRATDLRQDQYLPWIPTDRLENSLSWRPEISSALEDTYLQVQSQWVARQHRYTAGSDFAAPPASYHLLHLNTGTQWKLGEQTLGLHFSVNNLTNTLYKEYMNRFRYYAHDVGRNFTARVSWRF